MFATILVSILACTQMESPGKPFSSVQIAEEKRETNLEPVASDKKEIDPLFEPVGSVLVVSEVDEQPKVESVEDTSQEELSREKAEEGASQDLVEVSSSKQEPLEERTVLVEAEIQTEQEVNMDNKASFLQQWPLRIVKTEAGLNPPRAILGLPSGEEVVIRPGMQLPEENLVVMSIGAKAVILARIHTEGDHARIEHLTIPSLND